MKTVHTPGPWHLDPPESSHVTSEDYHTIRAGCGFLAESKEFREMGFQIAGHMTVADARLIAVAPDMFLALVMVIDTIGFQFMEPQIQDMVSAAIDKATGAA